MAPLRGYRNRTPAARQGDTMRTLAIERLEDRRALARPDFSVVMLPDTQMYTDHLNDRGEAAPRESRTYFQSQTKWVVDNLVTQNIKFVTHVGDVIEHDGTRDTRLQRWSRADAAMRILDGDPKTHPNGVVPYSVVLGNHDYDTKSMHTADEKHGGAESFVKYFGKERFTNRTWYGGASDNNVNSFQLFESNGIKFLHIALEFEARQDANPKLDSVKWAQKVIDDNPGRAVILSTHAYLHPSRNGTTSWGVTNKTTGRNGSRIFDELVKPNPEIFMVLSGHFTGTVERTNENKDGTTDRPDVYEVVTDFQGDANGGNGYFRLFRFDTAKNTITSSVVSNVPGVGKPRNTKTRDYTFTWDVDFETRIALKTTARLQFPLDLGNSAQKTGKGDTNNKLGQVDVTSKPTHFLIKLADIDDGIRDSTVVPESIELFRNGVKLVRGSHRDYQFSYNADTDSIRLTGDFVAGSYHIRLGQFAKITNNASVATQLPYTVITVQVGPKATSGSASRANAMTSEGSPTTSWPIVVLASGMSRLSSAVVPSRGGMGLEAVPMDTRSNTYAGVKSMPAYGVNASRGEGAFTAGPVRDAFSERSKSPTSATDTVRTSAYAASTRGSWVGLSSSTFASVRPITALTLPFRWLTVQSVAP